MAQAMHLNSLVYLFLYKTHSADCASLEGAEVVASTVGVSAAAGGSGGGEAAKLGCEVGSKRGGVCGCRVLK
jgi:hypothetical protein